MNVVYGLKRASRLYGRRVAIDAGGVTLTYAEFCARTRRVANALHSLGVRKGDRVAVLLENSPPYLELYYATAWLGALIVPLNTRLGCDEMAFWLNDSEAKVWVVDRRFAQAPQQILDKLVAQPALLFAGPGECPDAMLSYHSLVDQAADDVPVPEPEDHDLAGLFYTSGTTGGPKGVMLTHRNLYSNAVHGALAVNVASDWTWLHAAPMFHLANGAFMYALTMAGARHCFLPAFEPEAFLKAVERHRITSTILVPTMLNLVVNHPAIDRYDTSSLRHLIYGASPMPCDLLRRCIARFGGIFCQGYGLSEASPLLCVLAPEDHRFDNLDQALTPVRSAGRAVIGVEVRVVDDEDRDVAPGEMGEVIARGDNVMHGYWKRPEISANTLRGGWLHTGDLGALDENGYLYILDRAKDMVKTGGENVYSPEVEAVIYEHPEVLEAAVIGVPDDRWGEAIKAVVVRKPGSELCERVVIDFCRKRLTHFKCPTSVDFIEALPKGGTGKIQKNKLREPYWCGQSKGVH